MICYILPKYFNPHTVSYCCMELEQAFGKAVWKIVLTFSTVSDFILGINKMSTDSPPENPGVSSEGTDDSAPPHGGELSEPSSPTVVKTKVDVLLKPAGDAPIMKKKKWAVERNKKIVYVSDFIKKFIRLQPNESIFLYVNQSFSPSPDTEIGSVFDCFGSDGKLVLHYCKTQAWG